MVAFPAKARHPAHMFIRRTNTRNRKTGEAYFTHRLVEAVRVGKVVRQRTLLNLGTHFDLPQERGPIWLAGSAKCCRARRHCWP